jgi:hypothetical protein
MRAIRGTEPRKQNLRDNANAATVGAVSQLYQLLAAFGATITGITAIGYLVGWRLLNIYYSHLGVGWYVKSLPTSRALQESESLLLIFAIFTVIGVNMSMRGANSRRMEWYALIPAFIGALLVVCVEFADSKFSAKTSYYLALFGGACFIVSAGFTVAEMISKLRESKLKFSSVHLGLLFSVFSYGILQGPPAIANSKARFHMNPATSPLQHVVKKGCGGCIWRLVDVVDNKALLARISSNQADRTFLLISLDENWEIGL